VSLIAANVNPAPDFARLAGPITISSAPAVAPRTDLHDRVFENLAAAPAVASNRISAILDSVSSLNFLALSSPERSGVLGVRDLFLAESDDGGLISDTKRRF
jgi:hypothetical protein